MKKKATKLVRKPTQAVKSAEQVERLERYLQERGQIYIDVWRVGCNTGLRISDLLALKMKTVSDIDQSTGEIHIIEIKTGKQKTVVLNDRALGVINRRVADYPNDVFLFESSQRFDKHGQRSPVTRRQIARVLEAGGKELSPKLHLSTHSMRKTRGYSLYKAGIDIHQIAKALNHSSPATTMAYIGIDAENVAKNIRDVLV